jgi:hypothetical protein
MPWEITIRRADGARLGDLAEVRQHLSAALPAIKFRREPSGIEKIAAARAVGVEFPEIIRQHLEQRSATEQAEFEGDGFSVVAYGFERQPLDAIHVEIRGEGNPVGVLAALCLPQGWIVVDDSIGQPVELAGDAITNWETFREYRDRAIRNIQTTNGADA